jgi:hypothetical protein
MTRAVIMISALLLLVSTSTLKAETITLTCKAHQDLDSRADSYVTIDIETDGNDLTESIDNGALKHFNNHTLGRHLKITESTIEFGDHLTLNGSEWNVVSTISRTTGRLVTVTTGGRSELGACDRAPEPSLNKKF